MYEDEEVGTYGENANGSVLDGLVGETVTTIMFVMDYLRIEFQYGHDGPFFECYTWPVVSIDGTEHRFADSGYRDALCALIGREVTRVVESRQDGIVIQCGSRVLRVKPRLEDLVGPEIAQFRWHPSDGPWDLWSPGHGIFEMLS